VVREEGKKGRPPRTRTSFRTQVKNPKLLACRPGMDEMIGSLHYFCEIDRELIAIII